jgi:hypothetical protein
LSPRGEFCRLGVKLSPGGEILCSPPILLNSRECSPLGVKLTPEGPGVKLRMAL